MRGMREQERYALGTGSGVRGGWQCAEERARAVGAWIKAGRGKELMHCQSFAEMYEVTRQGRK
jgi:hypothetical protein